VNSSIEGYLCDFVWREERLVVRIPSMRLFEERAAVMEQVRRLPATTPASAPHGAPRPR
jgi:hypothetical protein